MVFRVFMLRGGSLDYDFGPKEFVLLPNAPTDARLKNVVLDVNMPQRKEPLISQEVVMDAASADGLEIAPVHWQAGETGFYWRDKEKLQFILQEKPSAPHSYEIIVTK